MMEQRISAQLEQNITVKPWNDWKLLAMICLTMGLAPFYPEPHVWGKLRWVAGGAIGMQPIDRLDLLMHGAPWLLFVRALLLRTLWKKSIA